MKNPLSPLSTLIVFSLLCAVLSCSKKGGTNTPQPALSINQSAATISANGNSKDSFPLSSNTPWTATSDQTWLTLSPTSGNGNAQIIATATVNFGSSDSRKATITISAAGVASQSLTVTQEAGVVMVAGNGTRGTSLGQLGLPYGIFVDANQNLYVAEAVNNRVTKWSQGATLGIIVAGNGDQGANIYHLNQLDGPVGVWVDATGNVFVADEANARAVKWAPNATQGTLVASTDTTTPYPDPITGPSSIWLDNTGNIYMAEQDVDRVEKWTPGSLLGTVIAGTGTYGPALNQLSDPDGIYFDSVGNLYIADGGNHRIVKWAPGANQGTIVAGTGAAGTALNQFNDPISVFFDKPGNMYVADFFNNRVMKWAPGASQGTIAAGTGTQGNAMNQLYNPTFVFLDTRGYLYVSDGGNDRVMRWAQ